MKSLLVTLILAAYSLGVLAQSKTTSDKVVKATEKVNQKTEKLSNASNQVANQAGQISSNAQNVIKNVKAVVKVFEPILQYFKRNKKIAATKTSNESEISSNGTNSSSNGLETATPTEYPNFPPMPPSTATNETNSSSNPSEGSFPTTSNSESGSANYPSFPNYGTPENEEYNSDGSANWGNQDNAVFGNCLDAFSGKIKNLGEGEENPNSIDLIFLAPSDGQNAYYLITPDFAKNNASADAFWGSATTDNPVKKWNDVNESQVAETKITGTQFFKIKTNTQLISAVKSARGYASFYSSISKLDGKVFAVKTNMNNRDAYALIYIAKHIGTSGSNGCLKIFIKCNGIDSNGDGYSEPINYNR
ncbi:MAG: hypothetical protein KA319_11195 [Ferruginibacter sp.]|nr:hypothetical protein [Ferruginibacter sp.]